MNTRRGLAFIDSNLTFTSCKSSFTNTSVGLNPIYTNSTIYTGTTLTIVNVGLTILAREATGTAALVVIRQVCAFSSISALSSTVIYT